MRIFVALAICAPLGAAFLPTLRPPASASSAPSPRRSTTAPKAAATVAAPGAMPAATLGCVSTTLVSTYYYAPPTAPSAPSPPVPTSTSAVPSGPTVPRGPGGFGGAAAPTPPTMPSGPVGPRGPTLAPPSGGAQDLLMRGGSVPAPRARKPAGVSATPWWAWWEANRWRLVPASPPNVSAADRAALVGNLRQIATQDRHHDPQSAALIALGKLGTVATDGTILARLSDFTAHAFVRESAALAGGMGATAPLAVAALAGDRSRPRDERVHALLGLGLGGDRAMRNLVATVVRVDYDPAVRCAALVAAGLLGGDECVDTARRVVLDRASPSALRAAAAACLGRAGARGSESAAVASLLRKLALTDSSPTVRLAAVLGLREVGGPRALDTAARVAWCDQDPEARGVALVVAAELAAADAAAGDRVIAAAMRGLVDDEATVRGFAALSLGLAGRRWDQARATLRARLGRETEPAVHSACLVALGLARDRDAVAALAACAADSSVPAEQRGFACVGLSMLAPGDDGVRKFLSDMGTACNNPEIKAAAVLALADTTAAASTPVVLRSHLADRNHYFKLSVVVAMGRRRDPVHLVDLWNQCRVETNPEARAFAVVAVGCIADASPVPSLRRLASGFTPAALGAEYPAIARVLALH